MLMASWAGLGLNANGASRFFLIYGVLMVGPAGMSVSRLNTAPAEPSSGQNATSGTHTGRPQHVSIAHISLSAHSPSDPQSASPAQLVCPSTQTPPPEGVETQTGDVQSLLSLQAVKVAHVAPSHSGSGLLTQGGISPPECSIYLARFTAHARGLALGNSLSQSFASQYALHRPKRSPSRPSQTVSSAGVSLSGVCAYA
jgi:hypothetical protein